MYVSSVMHNVSILQSLRRKSSVPWGIARVAFERIFTLPSNPTGWIAMLFTPERSFR